MPRVVTSVRDPVALAATCRELSLSTPKEGTFQFHQEEVPGWVVRLPELRFPVVFALSTGLVAYHQFDNAHEPYAHLMRFIHRFYAVQARLQRTTPAVGRERRLVPAREAV